MRAILAPGKDPLVLCTPECSGSIEAKARTLAAQPPNNRPDGGTEVQIDCYEFSIGIYILELAAAGLLGERSTRDQSNDLREHVITARYFPCARNQHASAGPASLSMNTCHY